LSRAASRASAAMSSDAAPMCAMLRSRPRISCARLSCSSQYENPVAPNAIAAVTTKNAVIALSRMLDCRPLPDPA
jgi:hypothetical protein